MCLPAICMFFLVKNLFTYFAHYLIGLFSYFLVSLCQRFNFANICSSSVWLISLKILFLGSCTEKKGLAFDEVQFLSFFLTACPYGVMSKNMSHKPRSLRVYLIYLAYGCLITPCHLLSLLNYDSLGHPELTFPFSEMRVMIGSTP